MIYGIGLDIVELSRIKRLLEKNPRFEKRILTSPEQKRLERLRGNRRIEYVAGRFAAKEAFVKAAGTGISVHYGFQDISILNNDLGKPILTHPAPDIVAHLSITHSKDDAAAQVVLEKQDSR